MSVSGGNGSAPFAAIIFIGLGVSGWSAFCAIGGNDSSGNGVFFNDSNITRYPPYPSFLHFDVVSTAFRRLSHAPHKCDRHHGTMHISIIYNESAKKCAKNDMAMRRYTCASPIHSLSLFPFPSIPIHRRRLYKAINYGDSHVIDSKYPSDHWR